MLIVPPLEIIKLVDYVYDESGSVIGEKISDSATTEQKEMFAKYLKDYEEALRTSFRVDLSDRTYNPVDGWKSKR